MSPVTSQTTIMATNIDLDRVCDVVKRIGELDVIEPDQDFYSAGIDSMRGMDIMLELESEFDLTIPDDKFVKARTPRALHDLVAQLRDS